MKHNKKEKNKKSALNEKLKLLRRVSMTEEEKDRMSSFLSRYVELHPVLGEQERVIKERKEKYSALSNIFSRLTPGFALFVFFIWGGVALAGTSLPGDNLYHVKTTSEKIREVFSFDTEQRARYKAERINYRLTEAQKLLEQGSVSEKSIERLVHELKVSLEDLRTSLNALEAEGEYFAAFEIERTHRSSIDAYKDVFLRMSEESEEVRSFLRNVALQFGLDGDYFALNNQRNSTALARGEDSSREVSMLSLAQEDEATELLAVEEFGDDARMLETEAESMLVSDEGVEGETFEAESVLDFETLKLYVSVRISETERQIARARKLDPRLRSALERQLEEASLLYESGVVAGESQEEDVARSLFLDSLNLVGEIYPLLRMATNKPSELFIVNILKTLEQNDAVEDVELFLEEEEVRGSRESADTASSETEESVMDGVLREDEPEVLESEGELVNSEEVRELLREIEL